MWRVGSETRNLLVLLLMVGGLAILVVLAQRHGNPTIMPPEPQELASKRSSPDNAFYTLRPARNQLRDMWDTAKPPDEEVDGEMVGHRIGDTLEEWIDADDPRAAAFLEECRPLVSSVRRAFRKPFYLCPKIGDIKTDTDDIGNFRELGQVLVACGRLRARTQGADEEAFAYLLDCVRLGRMEASDGPYFSFMMSFSTQRAALEHVTELAALASSPEVLRSALEGMLALTSDPIPLVARLEFGWRQFDNSQSLASEDPHMKSEGGKTLEELWREYSHALEYKRALLFAAEHPDTLRQLIKLSYPQYRSWEERHRDLAKYARNNFVRGFVTMRAYNETDVGGGVIALALELYRRDHETLPGTLDALTPDYLAEVPHDPFSGEPLIYRVEGGDYLLYSVGRTGRDDGGSKGRDVLCHTPPGKDE